MLAVIVRYVVLGTALEEVSTILITVPVILPIVAAIGYDGIWFGIFVTAMATIGLISPPVGLTVFVIQAQNPKSWPPGCRAGGAAGRVPGARSVAARVPKV